MRRNIRDIQQFKRDGQRITMLTAYDAMSALAAEDAGAEILLVGDSLGMVIQGRDSTIPVTMEQVIYHAEIVARVSQRPLVVGDMPFMTYAVSPERARANAARLMQESGVGAVKLEGGRFMAPTVRSIVKSGIPVMGHLGLTPQSVHQHGGFRIQGRSHSDARALIQAADALQSAGAFGVVLELVPADVAALISQRLEIPTFGIGAGPDCDGEVQVFHDLLALLPGKPHRHTRHFASLGQEMRDALRDYVSSVKAGTFPTVAQSALLAPEIRAALYEEFSPGDEAARAV